MEKKELDRILGPTSWVEAFHYSRSSACSERLKSVTCINVSRPHRIYENVSLTLVKLLNQSSLKIGWDSEFILYLCYL